MGKLCFMSSIISDSVECRLMYVSEDEPGRSPNSLAVIIYIVLATDHRSVSHVVKNHVFMRCGQHCQGNAEFASLFCLL